MFGLLLFCLIGKTSNAVMSQEQFGKLQRATMVAVNNEFIILFRNIQSKSSFFVQLTHFLSGHRGSQGFSRSEGNAISHTYNPDLILFYLTLQFTQQRQGRTRNYVCDLDTFY